MRATVKAELSPTKVTDNFVEREKRIEVQEHYLPHLSNLRDRDLLGELSYWRHLVYELKKYPYAPKSRQEVFIVRILKMGISGEIGHLRGVDRANVMKACIALRSRVVPLFPVPAHASLFLVKREKEPAKQMGLCFDSDWTLAQRLASMVGSCRLKEYELKNIAKSWREAQELGSKFSFKAMTRGDAELLYLRIFEREREFCREQVEAFKGLVGAHKVALCGVQEVQQSLF